MSMNNLVLMAAVEAERAAKEAPPNLEDQLRAAMRAVQGHWALTNEDEQFLAACEGAGRVCTSENRERIETAMRFLQSLASAASGVPVDFGALVPADEEDRIEPAPLKRIWDEVRT